MTELNDFRTQFPDKPLYVTEYGAEAIPGLHEQPSAPFTEQYQVEVIQKTTEVLEVLRRSGQLSGEMIWNFADFMTAPSDFLFKYFISCEVTQILVTQFS